MIITSPKKGLGFIKKLTPTFHTGITIRTGASTRHVTTQLIVLSILLLIPVCPVVGEGEPVFMAQFSPGPNLVLRKIFDTLMGEETHVYLNRKKDEEM